MPAVCIAPGGVSANRRKVTDSPASGAGDGVGRAMPAFLLSSIHFVQQVLTERLPWAPPCANGVQLTVPELTFRLSLGKAEGNGCGKMGPGGEAFQVEEQHMGRF